MARYIALLLLALGGCGRPSSTGQATPAQPPQVENDEPPKTSPSEHRAVSQQAACPIDDLKAESEDTLKLLRNIARECKPIDQCLLECIRSGCAYNIGGGCFHACGLRGARPDERDALLLREAAKYRDGTNYFCRYREPAKRLSVDSTPTRANNGGGESEARP